MRRPGLKTRLPYRVGLTGLLSKIAQLLGNLRYDRYSTPPPVIGAASSIDVSLKM